MTSDQQPGVLIDRQLPPGYGSVNPFAAVRGPGGAAAFIDFVVRVFGAHETLAAHTIDADDLLIHAEVRIGDSTLMLCDAKPHWAFTPALLQVYVSDAQAVVDRARAAGAEVITDPTRSMAQHLVALRIRGRQCGAQSSSERTSLLASGSVDTAQ